MRRHIFAALAVVLLQATASSAFAQARDSAAVAKPAAGIEGRWHGTIQAPDGAMDTNCQIKKEKDGYSGTISGPEGDVPLREIKLEGNKLTAVATIGAGGNNIDVWYSFTLKDDTLTGNASVNFNGQSMAFDLVLKKVVEK